ncbi:carbohydrate porin [Sphingobium sp. BYY-5]|uniref:carbohydrate porin n=1 Tax=Sphingobium sp. BYY-5 TaxID=2926400 RepID=UPI001FA7F415|nr:carbohydrate porin [Sphingobium sp. BYY-5]
MILAGLLLAGAGLPAAEAASVGPITPVRPHSHIHAGQQTPGEGPIVFDLTYSSDTMGVVSGGVKRRVRYLDNLDLVLEVDLEDLVGWQGAEMHVYGLYNNGRSMSQVVGDAQMVSEIEANGRAVKLYEAWIDQMLAPNLSLRAGIYDLNSEFDVLETATLFVGGAHGMGSDIGMSGRNGPSIFPATGLAARALYRPAKGWTIRAAILDGMPGNPEHPSRTSIRLGGGEGALLIGEVEAPIADGRLLLGHWRYTSSFDRFEGTHGGGNAGYYLRGEKTLIEDGDRRVDGFFRLGTAAKHYNMFDRFVSAGFKLGGWIDGRPEDEIGFAMIGAFTSPEYRRANDAGRSEIVAEATYRAPLTPWLTIQPDLQYVRNPSADPSIDDAWVIGLRVEMAFRLID